MMIATITWKRFFRNPGYPTAQTHRLLMDSKDIVPGFTAQEFHQRRLRLLYGGVDTRNGTRSGYIPEEKAIVLLCGYKNRYLSGKIFYPFHQNTNVLYLSGIDDPDSVVMFIKNPSLKRGYKFVAFVRHPSKHDLLWEGPLIGIDGAINHFGADEAFSVTELPAVLKSILKSEISLGFSRSSDEYLPVYFDFPQNSCDADQHLAWPEGNHLGTTTFHRSSRRHNSPFDEIFKSSKVTPKPLVHLMDNLRLIKSETEIKMMQKACDITEIGFRKVMEKCRLLETEHDLANLFEYQVRKNSAQKLAYVPVVAGRAHNAHIIHYTRNNMEICRDDLVLMDAGCIYNSYNSDITRTFPSSGKFSKHQKLVYEALLEIQCDFIKQSVKGDNLGELYLRSIDRIRKDIVERLLGISPWLSRQMVNRLYPHHIGHFLGMDVHDCAQADSGYIDGDGGKRWFFGRLENNMCITIEPGVYIPPVEPGEDSIFDEIPKEFRGISIRIEDNVVVRDQDPLVLSRNIPKSVKEIEKVMS